jgi:hypothetical protein
VTTIPTPAMGRMVHYKLTPEDADKIYRRRARLYPDGDFFTGNVAMVGNAYPAMIVSVGQDGLLNLQVFLDGCDATYWVQGRPQSSAVDETEQGTWNWPPRV